MSETKNFCCKEIELLINDPESPLEYEPTRRLYFLVSVPKEFRRKNELSIAFEISHCPKCGKELPKDLSDEWLSIVEKEFGITSPLDEKIETLPQKFRTDKWWKKRGL